jgi:hypothetical protein
LRWIGFGALASKANYCILLLNFQKARLQFVHVSVFDLQLTVTLTETLWISAPLVPSIITVPVTGVLLLLSLPPPHPIASRASTSIEVVASV